MRAAAGRVVGVLKALANDDRLLLLWQLSQGELCVSELEDLLDIHQPTLSQQLRVLRAERVVATRRDGKRIFYSIADPKVLEVLAVLTCLYSPGARTIQRGRPARAMPGRAGRCSPPGRSVP